MKNYYKRQSLILLLIIFLYSCFPSTKTAENKVFKNGSDWIPEGFNPKSTTLLIQLLDDKRPKAEKKNEEMRNYMQEKYIYKYEFASLEEIEGGSKKFNDYLKYPYALLISYGTYAYSGAAGRESQPVYDFYFIERSTGKKYPKTKKFSSNIVMTFFPVINTILEEK